MLCLCLHSGSRYGGQKSAVIVWHERQSLLSRWHWRISFSLQPLFVFLYLLVSVLIFISSQGIISVRIIACRHSIFRWHLKASKYSQSTSLHHWLSVLLHVLMTWLKLRSAQVVLGLNPCQWKREDQDLNQQESSIDSVRVSFIVQSDHT